MPDDTEHLLIAEEQLEEGTLDEWLVETGEAVEEDEAIARIKHGDETVTVVAPRDGTVTARNVDTGDSVDRGDGIATIAYQEDGTVHTPSHRQRYDAPAVLSFFIPGLGQLVKHEVWKGIGLFIMAVGSAGLALVWIGFLTYPAVWLYAIHDAYRTQPGDGS